MTPWKTKDLKSITTTRFDFEKDYCLHSLAEDLFGVVNDPWAVLDMVTEYFRKRNHEGKKIKAIIMEHGVGCDIHIHYFETKEQADEYSKEYMQPKSLNFIGGGLKGCKS